MTWYISTYRRQLSHLHAEATWNSEKMLGWLVYQEDNNFEFEMLYKYSVL